MAHRPLLPLAAALSLLAAAPASCPGPERPADPLARRQIEAVMERYVSAYRRDDADAMAALYDANGILLPPGRDLIRGRAAIRRFWSQGMEQGIEMQSVVIGAGASTGYVVGRYYIPADDEDEAESGKYVITLDRPVGGSWAVAADIWNDDGDDSTADESADSTAAVAARAVSYSSRRMRLPK
ncbi:MAG TPA: nuclear transport factor 2 family protein [Gemmatimonadales bacterium]|nr:nuclear transport factor 2 family protein [Gemmatimonadales bacterium]